jgi:hypothetical protein
MSDFPLLRRIKENVHSNKDVIGTVVRFTSEHCGTVVAIPTGKPFYKIGHKTECWISCFDGNVWEVLTNLEKMKLEFDEYLANTPKDQINKELVSCGFTFDLANCPFCGKKPVLSDIVDTHQNMKSLGWKVRCVAPECEIHPQTLGEISDAQIAILTWNKRA